jgi:DNA (cytosine-5)-methyltransferase 1
MPRHSKPRREPKEANYVGTVSELFAGVGGFRLGLESAGWRTVFSNQWEPSTKIQHASDCYVHNFGKEGHTNVDISVLMDEHVASGGRVIPRTDLVVGGFPCQDYSVAKSLNSAKGLQGKKGVLWWDIHRLVEANRPRFVLLENVDRLLKSPASQRGRDFAIMLSTLGSLGYVIEWRVVNAAQYGFPQRRIRVLIMATRVTGRVPLTSSKARELLFHTGVLARALPSNAVTDAMVAIDLTAPPEGLSTQFGRGGGPTPFMGSGVYYQGTAYTCQFNAVSSEPGITLGDILVPDTEIPEKFWIPEARLPEWHYLKGAKTIQRVHRGSGAAYEYAEGRMAFPDLLTNPSRTILTGEGGSSPSRFKHVIERPTGFRRLIPRELERLNGFPDDWTRWAAEGVEISDARRAFFMGNALVVGLIERVGAVLADEVRRSSRRTA